MTAPTFTKGRLREIAKRRSVAGDYYTQDINDLAAFALALLDRAETAEAERDRLREELREAEEAINAASGMSFLREMGWTEHPAVRRAIDRAGGKG